MATDLKAIWTESITATALSTEPMARPLPRENTAACTAWCPRHITAAEFTGPRVTHLSQNLELTGMRQHARIDYRACPLTSCFAARRLPLTTARDRQRWFPALAEVPR